MIEFMLITYTLCAVLLALYGLNCHVLVRLFNRHKEDKLREDRRIVEDFFKTHTAEDLPVVTTQLPLYNEANVAERIIEAVAAFDYPAGKHEIQVLDDSTDETREIAAAKVEELRRRGVDIVHITRDNRRGYKAGALKEGLATARGEFIAIFDADFVPTPDFLLKTIPHLATDDSLGMVQARWGHINGSESVITRLQTIGINGHFIIEQPARSWSGLYLNFNGTAGVFRRRAIEDAGNWRADTLTEDLDLSYRVQLAGWKFRYLVDLEAPAELPGNIIAFKNQQFRWAKGSMQTAIKLLPRVMREDVSWFKKAQAVFHVTHYMVHPLMAYLALMSLPLLWRGRTELPGWVFVIIGMVLILSSMGPSKMYWTAELSGLGGRPKRLWLLPVLVCFGCGLALNNTRAIIEAFAGKESEFIRTPKQGGQRRKRYRVGGDSMYALEILLGLWCFAGLWLYIHSGQYLIGPFLLTYAIGFTYIGVMSYLQRNRV